jgi:hypothetical protein
MSIEHWWHMLAPATQARLIETNGDELSATVVAEITAAGGEVPSDAHLSDDEVDWIEAMANEEMPA